jgi:hypothetical protein
MDIVNVMAPYLPVARVCSAQSREAVYTHATGKYAAITPNTSILTGKVEQLL